jgi:hypothetical protein
MKKYMALIIGLSSMAFLAYGASSAVADGVSSTSKTMFYKIEMDNSVGEPYSHFYALGTMHSEPMESLPPQVLECIKGVKCIYSEIGLAGNVRWNLQDVEWRASKALTKAGEEFGDHDAGWFKLISSEKQHDVKTKILKFLEEFNIGGTADRENIHLISPVQLYRAIDWLVFGPLIFLHEEDSEVTSMDVGITDLFVEKKVFSLEDEASRLACQKQAIKNGQSGILTVEEAVEKLITYCTGSEDEIEELYAEDKADFARQRPLYVGGDIPESEDNSQDWDTNLRNQYWIEKTLRMVPFAEPFVIVVGAAHLDMGCIPEVGKTGVLNFFQKLEKTNTPWMGGLKVRSIERLVHNDAVMDSLAKDAYHWVPLTISTEGPYLEGLMARLKAEATSGAGGGAASSAGGATASLLSCLHGC